MTSRERRLDELEAAFAKVPVEPVKDGSDLAERERIRASRHFGFTTPGHQIAGLRAALADQAARIYRDVTALMRDYSHPERDAFDAMGFGASFDQLMLEQYGVTLDDARRKDHDHEQA